MLGNGDAQTNLSRHAGIDTSPRWSPDGSRIAFVSWRDGSSEIYTMRADGSELVRQTNSPDTDTNPLWSPDGRTLLFTRRANGQDDLWKLTVDVGRETLLTSGDYDQRDAEWSPDGEWVLCVRKPPGGAPQIWKIAAAVSGPQLKLTNVAGGAGDARWSPDGRWIVYAAARDGAPDIWKMRPDGTGKVQLTHDTGVDRDPRWSPDGRTIVFVSSRDGNEELYRMTPDGDGQTNLTRSPGFDGNPRWSDDSAHILFDSSRTGGGIFAMAADGTAVWALATGMGAVQGHLGPRLAATVVTSAPTPAAQGGDGLIVFARNTPGRPEDVSGEIWLMEPDGRNQRAVPGTQQTRMPALSYDRRWVAYIRFDPLAPAEMGLWVCRPDGSERRPVRPATPRLIFVEFPMWFADNRRILVRTAPLADADWTRKPMYGWVDIITGEWREVPIVGYQVDLSPTGDRLAVVRSGEETRISRPGMWGSITPSHIWIADLDGRDIRQLTDDRQVHDMGPRWSPDGRMIAFFRRHALGGTSRDLPLADLCVVPASGGDPVTVVKDLLRPWSGFRIAWSPDGRKLVVNSSHQESDHSLYSVTLQGSQVTRLTDSRWPEIWQDWR